jgi:hypothetical protein
MVRFVDDDRTSADIAHAEPGGRTAHSVVDHELPIARRAQDRQNDCHGPDVGRFTMSEQTCCAVSSHARDVADARRPGLHADRFCIWTQTVAGRARN